MCARLLRLQKKSSEEQSQGGLWGDLYSFPLIFHLREDIGERLGEFGGAQGQFKYLFWMLWLAQFHDGATSDGGLKIMFVPL